MADSKLSALTELTEAPASTDELYLNDAGTSKRLTVANLISELDADVVFANHAGGALISWGFSGEVFTLEAGIAGKVLTAAGAGSPPTWEVPAGLETIWIPAAAMRPSVTAGCASVTSIETTANRPDLIVLDFDDTGVESAQFSVAMPKRWDLGTVTFQAFWTVSVSASPGTLDGVIWGLEGIAITADGSIDTAWAAQVLIGVDAQQSLEDLWVSAESPALTIDGTPVDDDLIFYRLSRVIGDAADDLDGDARLIGIKLFWTSDAGTDD